MRFCMGMGETANIEDRRAVRVIDNGGIMIASEEVCAMTCIRVHAKIRCIPSTPCPLRTLRFESGEALNALKWYSMLPFIPIICTPSLGLSGSLYQPQSSRACVPSTHTEAYWWAGMHDPSLQISADPRWVLQESDNLIIPRPVLVPTQVWSNRR